jgi:hypothetical protein
VAKGVDNGVSVIESLTLEISVLGSSHPETLSSVPPLTPNDSSVPYSSEMRGSHGVAALEPLALVISCSRVFPVTASYEGSVSSNSSGKYPRDVVFEGQKESSFGPSPILSSDQIEATPIMFSEKRFVL